LRKAASGGRPQHTDFHVKNKRARPCGERALIGF
jgi:hypothetical protein